MTSNANWVICVVLNACVFLSIEWNAILFVEIPSNLSIETATRWCYSIEINNEHTGFFSPRFYYTEFCLHSLCQQQQNIAKQSKKNINFILLPVQFGISIHCALVSYIAQTESHYIRTPFERWFHESVSVKKRKSTNVQRIYFILFSA